jgi:Trp operon repressor
MIQNNIHELMQKEMSRKELLGIVGFGIASIFGLSTILRMLGKGPQHANHGYGSSSYGGRKEA